VTKQYTDEMYETLLQEHKDKKFETVPGLREISGLDDNVMSGAAILEDFYDDWRFIMVAKFGQDGVDEAVFPRIPEEACIYDWCVDNYAWERHDET
jgi:hypothetical protein